MGLRFRIRTINKNHIRMRMWFLHFSNPIQYPREYSGLSLRWTISRYPLESIHTLSRRSFKMSRTNLPFYLSQSCSKRAQRLSACREGLQLNANLWFLISVRFLITYNPDPFISRKHKQNILDGRLISAANSYRA